MTDDPSTGTAGAIAARLASGGRMVDAGKFTLDPEAARVKLREHQLADPHAWVALLVEAASVAGSSSLSFQLGARRSSATFVGPRIEPERLESLFAAPFMEGSSVESEDRPAHELLAKLAIAANAALTLDIDSVWLECTTPRGERRRLTIPREGEPTLEAGGRSDESELRFVIESEGRDTERADAELAVLRLRCRWAKPKIEVDGVGINESRAAALGSGARMAVTSASGRPIGLARLGRGGQPAKLLLLTHGVLAETLPLPEAPTDFLALVDTELRKDIAQARVVRGPEFDATLAAVKQVWNRLGGRPPQTLTERKAVLAELHKGRPDATRLIQFATLLVVMLLVGALVMWLR